MKKLFITIFILFGSASAVTIYFPKILPIRFFGLVVLAICAGTIVWGFVSAKRAKQTGPYCEPYIDAHDEDISWAAIPGSMYHDAFYRAGD